MPSTLDKARQTGIVTLGVRESGGALSYRVDDGRYGGFHVALCLAIVSDIEKQIARAVEVRYQLVTAQNRVVLLQNGTIDMECGATTNNLARQRDVGFLNTTFVEEVRIAAKRASNVRSVAQLAGRNVVATTGTTSVQHLRRHQRLAGFHFNEIFGKDAADSFLLLETGRVDAFVTDAQVLAGVIAASKSPDDFAIVGEVLNVEPLAIMVRKDDAALKALGNGVIARMSKAGELDSLWRKWFETPIPPRGINLRLPVSETTRQAWSDPNDRPMERYLAR